MARPGQMPDKDVLAYLEDVVSRLERLGDRLETYVENEDPHATPSKGTGTDDDAPSS